jgi:hypothetical protein
MWLKGIQQWDASLNTDCQVLAGSSGCCGTE